MLNLNALALKSTRLFSSNDLVTALSEVIDSDRNGEIKRVAHVWTPIGAVMMKGCQVTLVEPRVDSVAVARAD